MKSIAFLVPSTSRNRDWEKLDDTYLYKYLLPSILPVCKDFKIKVFIGYDNDDELYGKDSNWLPQFYPPYKCDKEGVKFELEWVKCSGMKGMPTSVWNHIGHTAIAQDFEYFMVLGDDIVCDKRKEWLGVFLKNLNKNKNIGFSAGYSNNDRIPTQFLIHKTHIDIFGYIYPPTIKNWGCDDWMVEIYDEKYGYWNKEYKLYNVGGDPRYEVEFPRKYIHMLVNRHKKFIKNYVEKNIEKNF
jgi:hypothetical protein